MAALNMPDPFLANIVAIFLGNAWQTNAVNNSVTFQGTENSIITFLNAPNAPIILKDILESLFIYPNSPSESYP